MAVLTLFCVVVPSQRHGADGAAVPMEGGVKIVSGWTEGQVRAWLGGVARIDADHLGRFDGVSGAELLVLTEADLGEFTGFGRARVRVLWNMLHGPALPQSGMAELRPPGAEESEPQEEPKASEVLPPPPLNTGAPRPGCSEGGECARMPAVLDAGERIVLFKEGGGYGEQPLLLCLFVHYSGGSKFAGCADRALLNGNTWPIFSLIRMPTVLLPPRMQAGATRSAAW